MAQQLREAAGHEEAEQVETSQQAEITIEQKLLSTAVEEVSGETESVKLANKYVASTRVAA